MGLRVGKKLGLETGGTVPKYYRTENGSDYSLKEYGLVEDDSDAYEPRTFCNIMDSDGTVIYGDEKSPGSKLTKRLCKQVGKPLLINPNPELLRGWIMLYGVEVLNVAGNRMSKLTEQKLAEYEKKLTQALV
jgi:hypothetical protein